MRWRSCRSPAARVNAIVAGTSNRDKQAVTASVSVPTRDVEDLGVQADVRYDGDTLALAANPRFETRYLRGQAGLGYDAAGINAYGEVAGGLAFVADAGVFVTRPIGDGFAVIEVPEDLAVRGYRDNRLVGTTSGGQLLVPDLMPHYANRIAIDPADLGLDYELDAIERLVAPPYRGGVRVDFGVRKTLYVRGRIVRDGVALVHGRLVVGKQRSALGDAGEFELEGLGPGRHEGEAMSSGATCRVQLEVEGDGPIIDLGVVPCLP